MAIDTSCPHCAKRYRFKDEYAGKAFRCQNPDCKKPFPIAVRPASAGASARPKPGANVPAKPGIPVRDDQLPGPKPPAVDVDTLAHDLLADEPEPAAVKAAPPDAPIPMVCAVCDHKWDEPADKQGKNAICPECRHRQKVPERKVREKADWRNPNADRPSLARSSEPVPENVMGGRTESVSVESLEQAGVIEDDVEPRPKWHFVAAIAFPIALVGTLIYAGVTFWQGMNVDRRDDVMILARDDMFATEETPLAPAEAPLFRAAMRLASGEHYLRHLDPTPEQLTLAREEFVRARTELASAPRSLERDALYEQLALAQVDLGGSDAQVEAETRIRWTPARTASARIVINEIERSVQQELLQTLTTMRDADKPAVFEARLATVRGLTRKLCEAGQPDLIFGIVAQGFFPGEQPEALAACALERLRVTNDQTAATLVADDLKAMFAGGGPQLSVQPAAIQALWLSVDPPITAPTLAQPPTGSGAVPDRTRLAYTLTHLMKNEPDQALALATRPGTPDARVKALTLITEWPGTAEPTAQTTEAVKVATDIIREAGKQRNVAKPDPYTVLRIARAAAAQGQREPADELAAGIAGDGFQTWVRGDILRQRLAHHPETAPVDPTIFEVPDDPTKRRVGHAWGRMAIARHNTLFAGDSGNLARYDDWGAGSLKAFGLAGAALGLQDDAAR